MAGCLRHILSAVLACCLCAAPALAAPNVTGATVGFIGQLGTQAPGLDIAAAPGVVPMMVGPLVATFDASPEAAAAAERTAGLSAIAEAAALLRMNAEVLRRWLREGRIHGVKVGRGWRISEEALAALTRHDWPGNVRELFNTIEQAFVLSGGERVVYAQHLPPAVRIRVAKSLLFRGRGEGGEGHGEETEKSLPTLKDFKTAMEKDYLRRLLRLHGKDIRKMISVSALSRSHLYAMLKKHGLED